MNNIPSAVATAFLTAYAEHDLERMVALCAEDATFDYVPLGDAGRGRVREAAVPIWRSYLDAFEGFRPEVQEVFEDAANRVAVARVINRGVQRRDVGGIHAAGGELAAPHLFIFRIAADGRVSEIVAYWDNETIYSQLGRPESASGDQREE